MKYGRLWRPVALSYTMDQVIKLSRLRQAHSRMASVNIPNRTMLTIRYTVNETSGE